MTTISSHYQVGGSLSSEAPTYVVRAADRILYNSLLAGEYCYLLNARQMGKSSLRIRVMRQLQEQGVACAEVELSGIGSQQITASQWYGGLIQELISGFQLQINRREWLRDHEQLSPVQRLGKFIETVLLQQLREQVVIFIDEIDNVLSLSFPVEEFFALIRNWYDRRASHSDYQRLSVAILGVATPSDLISDPHSTPFNIGRAIDLTGFRFPEAQVLQVGLSSIAADPGAVITEILRWTGGQPFLTQKLCALVKKSQTFIPLGTEAQHVEVIVQTQIIHEWEAQDEPEHLRTIRDRLLRYPHVSQRLLSVYRKILQKNDVPFTSRPEHLELRLSGLVLQDQGKFRVKNPIYEAVFNLDWIAEQLRSLHPPVSRPPWWTTFLTSFVVAATVMGIRSLGWLQPLELQAYDFLMLQLPTDPPDSRLLIIEINEEDISERRYGFPVPDAILAQLIQTLSQYQPRAIGLDIIRDRPQPPGEEFLQEQFRLNHNLVAVCYLGQGLNTIAPPPGLPEEQVGFVDLFNDSPYDRNSYVTRRYLLSRSPNPGDPPTSCTTQRSLALELAARYLYAEGIPITVEGEDWKFGSITVPRLQEDSGAYQGLDASGNQMLIRFRNTPDPMKPAKVLSLQDVLEPTETLNPNWIRDRVVLIGVTAVSIQDAHFTPLGRLRGLHVHAHVISQLMSAAEDDDHFFLSWWPWWGEGVWIFCWSSSGAIIYCSVRKPGGRVLATGVLLSLLYGSCWLSLTQGRWIPFIPAVVALGGAALSLGFYSNITVNGDQSLR